MGKTHSYNDLQTWADKWDKAVNDRVFDTSNQPPVVSKQVHTPDFFNVNVDHSEEDGSLNEDAKYWVDLYNKTNRFKRPTEKSIKSPSSQVIKENLAVDAKSMVNTMASSPNPVRASSIGKDNGEDSPVAVGTTYGVEEFEKLEDLKIKLHNLIDKLNGFDAMGKASKLESQIQSVKKQIDEISDGLSKSIPSQQGD